VDVGDIDVGFGLVGLDIAISLSIAPIASFERVDLRDERPKRDAHAVGNHNLAACRATRQTDPLTT